MTWRWPPRGGHRVLHPTPLPRSLPIDSLPAPTRFLRDPGPRLAAAAAVAGAAPGVSPRALSGSSQPEPSARPSQHTHPPPARGGHMRARLFLLTRLWPSSPSDEAPSRPPPLRRLSSDSSARPQPTRRGTSTALPPRRREPGPMRLVSLTEARESAERYVKRLRQCVVQPRGDEACGCCSGCIFTQ